MFEVYNENLKIYLLIKLKFVNVDTEFYADHNHKAKHVEIQNQKKNRRINGIYYRLSIKANKQTPMICNKSLYN